MKKIITLLTLLFSLTLWAQDAHFSQAWNNSLQLNAAATGIHQEEIRLGALYRTQWAGIPEPYKHYGIYADANYKGFGLGMDLFSEDAGAASLKTTGVKLAAAYHQQIGQGNSRIAVGFNIGILQKKIDPSAFSFDSQFDTELGFDPLSNTGEVFTQTTALSPDLGGGLELTTNLGQKKNRWVKAGLAFSHLNRPKYALLSAEKQAIPLMWTAYTQVSLPLADAVTVEPRILLRKQGTAQEILVGVEGKLQLNDPTVLSLGVANRFKDALILNGGVTFKKTTVGLSYDVNISNLKAATKGNGALEVMLTCRFNQPKIKKAEDTDGDGIVDWKDHCPQIPGVRALNGCPVEQQAPNKITTNDADGDGVPDNIDECPQEPGLYCFQGCNDKDEDGIGDAIDRCPSLFGAKENGGCPVKVNDLDGDGVIDELDHCISIKGELALHGCPDTDKDGIMDADDQCPFIKGVPEKNGCPYTQNRTIRPANFDVYPIANVEFDVNQAIIKPKYYHTLGEFANYMLEHPEYIVELSGHTDVTGSAAYNLALSKRRTASVRKYLLRLGIPASRIEVASYGETIPVEGNDTPQGKAKNRRVELMLFKN